MGSRPGTFPETVGGLLTAACGGDSVRRAEAVNRLFLIYWRPVYAFIRKRGFAVEDAKDLTQDFMLELFKRGSLDRFDPGKGRFRSFLKGAIGLFLAQARRSESRRARRGGVPIPFSVLKDLEGSDFASDLERRSADELFDRQLAYELMSRAVRVLRRELRAEGREKCYEAFRRYELAPEKGSYQGVAEALGLTADAVRKHLEAARRRLRKILLQQIRECSTSRTEVAEELRKNRACWRACRLPDARMLR